MERGPGILLVGLGLWYDYSPYHLRTRSAALSVKAHSMLPVNAMTAANVITVAAMRHVMDFTKVRIWVSRDIWDFMGIASIIYLDEFFYEFSVQDDYHTWISTYPYYYILIRGKKYLK
jgi:hypothetical protein